MESAIRLIVKTPNQKFQDLQVNCDIDWTVKKLKEHLANVYPSKPKSDSQRLIYSGHLLRDELQLQELFDVVDKDYPLHIVHIVCPDVPKEVIVDKTLEEKQPSPPSDIPTSLPSSAAVPPELRHRASPYTVYNQPSPSNASCPESYIKSMYSWSQYVTRMQGYYTMLSHYQQQQLPQQSFWLEPAAVRQWHSNMMSFQQQNSVPACSGNAHDVASKAPVNKSVVPDAEQVHHEEVPTENGAAPNEDPVEVENVPNQVNPVAPLNAGGAMFNDDDENEDGRRDWLDWVHTFLRASVMLSIMYFYSSTVRILMIGLLGFIIYLYQAGWFFLRRGPQAVDNRNQDQNVDEEDADNNANDEVNGHNNETEQLRATGDLPGNINDERNNNFLTVMCTFVTTFFTSLLPQGA